MGQDTISQMPAMSWEVDTPSCLQLLQYYDGKEMIQWEAWQHILSSILPPVTYVWPGDWVTADLPGEQYVLLLPNNCQTCTGLTCENQKWPNMPFPDFIFWLPIFLITEARKRKIVCRIRSLYACSVHRHINCSIHTVCKLSSLMPMRNNFLPSQ